MAEYLTKQGDVLDQIAYKYYGNTNNRIVETILEQNVGLADHGAVLPEGLLITLPEQEQSTVISNKQVKLWD